MIIRVGGEIHNIYVNMWKHLSLIYEKEAKRGKRKQNPDLLEIRVKGKKEEKDKINKEEKERGSSS